MPITIMTGDNLLGDEVKLPKKDCCTSCHFCCKSCCFDTKSCFIDAFCTRFGLRYAMMWVVGILIAAFMIYGLVALMSM